MAPFRHHRAIDSGLVSPGYKVKLGTELWSTTLAERITGIRGGNTELAWGIEFQAGDVCVVFSIACYERKVIFKGSGSDDEV